MIGGKEILMSVFCFSVKAFSLPIQLFTKQAFQCQCFHFQFHNLLSLLWPHNKYISWTMQWSEISAPCCGRECVLVLCERACHCHQEKQTSTKVYSLVFLSLRAFHMNEWRTCGFSHVGLQVRTKSESSWRNLSIAVTWSHQTALFVN